METTGRIDKYWLANCPNQFYWAVWPDEEDVVFFHQGSGDTLLLNPLGEFLLKRLQSGRQTPSGLSAAAAGYFDVDNNKDMADAVLDSLHVFRTLGLVISGSL